MKAGVSTACLYPKPLEESLYELTLNGIQTVEIFVNTHSELKKNFAYGILENLRRFDARCVSVHPFTSEMETMMFFSEYERRMDDILEYYKHFFQFMNIVGEEKAEKLSPVNFFANATKDCLSWEKNSASPSPLKMWQDVSVRLQPLYGIFLQCWEAALHSFWIPNRHCVQKKILSAFSMRQEVKQNTSTSAIQAKWGTAFLSEKEDSG